MRGGGNLSSVLNPASLSLHWASNSRLCGTIRNTNGCRHSAFYKVPYNLKYLANAFWGISEKTARLSRLQAQAPDTGQFHHCQRCEVRELPFVHTPYRLAASEGPNLYGGGMPLQANA